jgi:alpha-N-arabinofuranosidase
VRPYEDNYYNTGRETFIAPVAWQDNWPIINPGSQEIKYTYPVAYPEVKLPGARPQAGNFAYTSTFDKPLDFGWLFLRTRDSSSYALSKAAGLTLKLKPETCAGTGNPAFVGRRQQHLHGSAETELTFAATSESEQAGLVVLQDEHHFYYLCQSVAGGKPVVQLFKSGAAQQPPELLAQQPLGAAAGKVRLRIRAEGATYGFDVAEGPKAAWRVLKDQVDARFLSTQVAGGFIGCLYGLYATSSGQPSSNSAAFKYLRYEGQDGTYPPAPAAGRKP